MGLMVRLDVASSAFVAPIKKPLLPLGAVGFNRRKAALMWQPKGALLAAAHDLPRGLCAALCPPGTRFSAQKRHIIKTVGKKHASVTKPPV